MVKPINPLTLSKGDALTHTHQIKGNLLSHLPLRFPRCGFMGVFDLSEASEEGDEGIASKDDHAKKDRDLK